jgi:hypothetical protein
MQAVGAAELPGTGTIRGFALAQRMERLLIRDSVRLAGGPDPFSALHTIPAASLVSLTRMLHSPVRCNTQ